MLINRPKGSSKMFGNIQITYTGYRNNCGPNSTPTQATYTVYANTYFAKTQLDADAMAQADINLNAQAYINVNATCTPWKLYEVRPFSGAGTYNWQAPGVSLLDAVFLVGGGGGGGAEFGGGGGYTKTFRNIPITPGQFIQIIIGSGGDGMYDDASINPGQDGGFSQFMNSNYRAEGGIGGKFNGSGNTGNGGSGGGGRLWNIHGVSDGNNSNNTHPQQAGKGQGSTTRDFGELSGSLNAGGGGGSDHNVGEGYGGQGQLAGSGENGVADYSSSYNYTFGYGGGGYGGGGGASLVQGGKGGDGTCLVRYYGP